MKTVSLTVKINKAEIQSFQYWVEETFGKDLIKFQINSNTDKLYQEDEYFKSMIKKKKKTQRIINDYINKYNKE